jgi:hypothetical protein
MYQKLIFLFVLSLFLLSAGRQTYSQNDLDTLWSKIVFANIENALFSPDDSKILVSCTEKFVELEGTTGDVLSEVAPFGGIHGLSKDKKFAVTLHPPIKIIDANDYSEIKVLSDKINIDGDFEIEDFSYTDDLKTFAFEINRFPSYINDSTVIIMNAETFESYLPFAPDENDYYSKIKISPNGDFLITENGEINIINGQNHPRTKVRLWSLKTNEMIEELVNIQGNEPFFFSWSPNSKYISIYDGLHIAIYDTDNMKFMDTINARGGVTSIAMQFTKDSDYLYFWGNGSQNNLQRYNLITKEIDLEYIIWSSQKYLRFSNNDNYFISGNNINLYLYNSYLLSIIKKHSTITAITPNPTKGTFKVTLPFSSNKINIDLYNTKGVLLTNLFNDSAIEGQILTFDISNQASGVYLLQISGDDRTESCKIIKE